MRIAIVGLGVQGRKRRSVAGDSVVAVVDPMAPGVDFQKIEDLPLTAYDAACVCVPDQEKQPILHYLLSHGKHVLVEKPLLGADEELRGLIELSQVHRAVCYTAYNHRFEPHVAKLKEILEAGTLGNIYLAKFFYGNGTARDVRNSPWRDKSLGVLTDLGSHLLDWTLFLFGKPLAAPTITAANRFENSAFDHFQFHFPGRPSIDLEMTLLSWRNTFRCDVFGELGSAHIDCLCKWGPSTLTVRTRVLPSGRPAETSETLEQSDPTWQLEYDHFLHLCRNGGTNLENDLWINDIFNQVSHDLGMPTLNA